MWKVALIALAAAVLLSTVQGSEPTYPRMHGPLWGGTGVQSWDRLLAELMQSNPDTGVCEDDRCYVTLGEESYVLTVDSEPLTLPSNPCVVYSCGKNGVVTGTIDCIPASDIQCADGASLIRYPGECCMRCEAPDTPTAEFDEWAEWTECSATCGGGRRARKRTCLIEDKTIVQCTGRLLEAADCGKDPCPIDCKYEYGEPEQCSATCGPGVVREFPIVTQEPDHGGRPCPPEVNDNTPRETPCNLRECPIDCKWEWGQFGPCTVTCGGGTQTRSPVITQQAMHGGTCNLPQPETRTCSTANCPIDCTWEWGQFGPCTVTCGGGTQTRSPVITSPPMHGGTCDLPPDETRTCGTINCPVDCKWEWGKFEPCTVTCGGGTQTRSPEITSEAMFGGTCNLPQPETRSCGTTKCPNPCGPGETRCDGVCVPDRDGDCVIDPEDNCPDHPNPSQEDQDNDGVGEPCDNCPQTSNPLQVNTDGDLTGDECDDDDDADGFSDSGDNCQFVPNNQANSDGDKFGDACDNCPYKSNANQADADKDGVGNVCDNCRFVHNPNQLDSEANNPACNVRPSYLMDYDYADDESASLDNVDKQNLAVQIMEKLLELYYSN